MMRFHARHTFAAAGLLSGLTVALAAHATFVAAGDTEVKFQAKGPAGLKIDGDGTTLEAIEKDGQITFVASVTDLKTGIGSRDKHLKETLKGHTKAQLVVSRSALKLPDDNQTIEGKTTGKFSFNGQKAPKDKAVDVPVEYQVKRTGSDYHVIGKTQINIEDYGIEKPCYLGVCVDPNVKVKIKIKLRDK